MKATLHWVAAADATTGEVRLYDHLFKRADPGAGGDLVADLDANSLTSCAIASSSRRSPRRCPRRRCSSNGRAISASTKIRGRARRSSTARSACATCGRKCRRPAAEAAVGVAICRTRSAELCGSDRRMIFSEKSATFGIVLSLARPRRRARKPRRCCLRCRARGRERRESPLPELFAAACNLKQSRPPVSVRSAASRLAECGHEQRAQFGAARRAPARVRADDGRRDPPWGSAST